MFTFAKIRDIMNLSEPKKDLHPLVEVIRIKVVALIDKARKENDWTLEQIAEKCGTSKGEICTLISRAWRRADQPRSTL